MGLPCVVVGDRKMLVKDVDLKVIRKLLDSVPDGIEVTAIDLSNGYQLKLVAGTEQLYEQEYAFKLKDLNNALDLLGEN